MTNSNLRIKNSAGLVGLVESLGQAADRRDLGHESRWTALYDVMCSTWCRRDDAGGTPDPTGRSFDPQVAAVVDTNLDRIAAVFGLDDLAADVLLVAAAADIDPNIAAAYGMLLGASSPRAASVALTLELAGVAVTSARGREVFAAAGPLMRWQLMEVAGGPHFLSHSVTAATDVAARLLGATVDDAGVGRLASPTSDMEDVAADGVTELATALVAGYRFFWIDNAGGGAGLAAARTAFAAADIRCVAATVDPVSPGDMTASVIMLVRWAGLHAAGLILSGAAALVEAGTESIAILASAPIPVVMVGQGRWNAAWHHRLPIRIHCGPLSISERLRLWRRHVPETAVPDDVLATYRLTPEQIDTAARYVATRLNLEPRRQATDAVIEAVRALGGAPSLHMDDSQVAASFADLQVPDETAATLHRLVSWVRLREDVIARGSVHGMGGKGTGITALFTGSPGTGKTLAAHVVADSVGLDLMQVDLSGVIDKYIGETEKNLERIFTDAENRNVVLFFDEADALFGKRSEVRDARDRFANQEVSYLLQRIEKFNGITVLATNLKGNLDIAFARRMHFIVHFPDPDEKTRAQLWHNLLQRAGDIDANDPIDIDRLAASITLAGGDMRNIVLGAVYDAAADGSGLGMRHLVTAAVREHTKLGRRAPTI